MTISSGVTLTVASGTEVHFLANTDDTGGGDDMARSELIVADGGVLNAVAGTTEADHITFRSANDAAGDGMHCVSADDDNDLALNNLSLANCGTPPTISGEPEEPEFPERSDSEAVVATYTATDDDEDAVTWSLDGDDASAFTIDSDDGELRFQRSPDFEALNGNPIYQVTVRAEDSQQAVSDYPVTVEVINIEEAGTVTV